MTPLRLRARLRAALFSLTESPDNVVTLPIARRSEITLHWVEGVPGRQGIPDQLRVDSPLHPRALAHRLRLAADQLDAEAEDRLAEAARRGERARNGRAS